MTSLPPGRLGLPIIGETLDFMKDGFGFVSKRLARHGPIYKTSLLLRNTAVISGPDAVGLFIDEDIIQREGSMPPHIQEIFGGRSLPLLDGPVHFARKTIVLQAFTRDAIAAYLPAMQRIVETACKRWAGMGEFRWLPELKKLALEAICTNVGGITAETELDALRRDYDALGAAFLGLPIPLPGTTYSKALAARNRIFEIFRRQVEARRRAPASDGLTRMLQASTEDGTRLTDDQAVLELHHAIIAGFIIFAEFATSVVELSRTPAVLSRLREEIRRGAPEGAVSPETLRGMPLLLQVVMETKRLTPIIPAVFGKAKREFTWRGVTVPKGWMVMWDVRGSNADPATYRQPASFDPDRFGSGREEHKKHEHAFTPQGGGPPTGHRCAGVDYSTVMMSVFLVVLLRSYEFTLPAQNLEYDWSKTPPEPADGLRAVLKAV